MNSTPHTKEMRKVKYVEPLSRYVLFVELSDGEYGYFDVKPYLEMGVFKELKDVDYFKKVRPVLGGISWPNEQDFSADTLAAGLIKDS